MTQALILFPIVFVLNIIPAFAPPTWMALSFISYRFALNHTVLLGIVAAAAATLGRVVLAKLSRAIIRRKLLSEEARDNLDAIKDALQQRKRLTFGVFLFYAFSPLPSNYLFIAYGLTPLSLTMAAVPFFLGRCVGYNFWVFAGSMAAKRIALESPEDQPYLSVYFVFVQLFSLALVYLFTKVDWRLLFAEHK